MVIKGAVWGGKQPDDVPPWGIYLGSKDDKGHSRYWDATKFTGLGMLLTRTGLGNAVQGIRQGKPAGEIGDQSLKDAANAFIRPAAGPGAQFVTRALTGHGLGVGALQDANRAAPGQSQNVENLKAALAGSNPTVQAYNQARAQGQGRPAAAGAALGKIGASFIGLKAGQNVESPALHLAHGFMDRRVPPGPYTEHEQQAMADRQQYQQDKETMGPEAAMDKLLASGNVTARAARGLGKKLNPADMTDDDRLKAAFSKTSLTPIGKDGSEARQVFSAATPEQKDFLRKIFQEKLDKAKKGLMSSHPAVRLDSRRQLDDAADLRLKGILK
jgi:hypothetical protein